ncbi:MAG: tetratricopeptide repeat protein [Agriterribacter sp.]
MAHYKDHIDQHLFEQIEAYLLHKMDADARAAFEKTMQADEALKNEVALQRLLTIGIEAHALSKEATAPPPPVKKINRVWLYAAAAVAVAVISLLWFSHSTPDKIFARYFVPDDGLPLAMSGNQGLYHFYNGMVSYKEEDYSKAIDIWQQIQPASDTVQYYLGVALLNNNNSTAAIPPLLKVAQTNESAWHLKASWYLALAYLKNNQTANAIAWLKKLNNEERARRLAKDIEKLSP